MYSSKPTNRATCRPLRWCWRGRDRSPSKAGCYRREAYPDQVSPDTAFTNPPMVATSATPGTPFKLVAQIPVLQRAQVGETVLMCMIHQRVFVDPSCACRVRSNNGVNDHGRRFSLDLLQILDHARASPIKIGSILKDNENI